MPRGRRLPPPAPPPASDGDDDAFALFAERFRPRLVRHARSILRHHHDAEDATQNALLKGFRALREGSAPECLLAWMLRVCSNECRVLQRAPATEVALTDALPARLETPEDRLERRERIDALLADLGELSEAQRTAFVLTRLADRSSADVARVLDRTPASVRALVHEADASLGEFRDGRMMSCDDVRDRLSSGGGRSRRARRISGHLRACPACRAYAEGIARPARAWLPVPAAWGWTHALSGEATSVALSARGIGAAAMACAMIVAAQGDAPRNGAAAVAGATTGMQAQRVALLAAATPPSPVPADGTANPSRTRQRPPVGRVSGRADGGVAVGPRTRGGPPGSPPAAPPRPPRPGGRAPGTASPPAPGPTTAASPPSDDGPPSTPPARPARGPTGAPEVVVAVSLEAGVTTRIGVGTVAIDIDGRARMGPSQDAGASERPIAAASLLVEGLLGAAGASVPTGASGDRPPTVVRLLPSGVGDDLPQHVHAPDGGL